MRRISVKIGEGREGEVYGCLTCWGQDTDRQGSMMAMVGSMVSCRIEAFRP